MKKNIKKRNLYNISILFLLFVLISIIGYKLLRDRFFTSDNSIKTIEQSKVSEVISGADSNSENTSMTNSETTSNSESSKQPESTEQNKNSETPKEENITETKIIEKIENPDEKLEYSEAEKNLLIQNLPESLQMKIERYPESLNTVIQYEKYKDDTSVIDITSDYNLSKNYIRNVKLPYLSQWDKRWGFRKVDDEFIGNSGCGPVSLTMIYTGLTGDTSITPPQMAQRLFDLGVYSRDGGEYGLFVEGPRSLGLNSYDIGSSADALKNALSEGKIVVALVRHNGIGDFTYGGHYIVITEIDENNQLSIYDVNSYNNTNKKWDLNRVMQQTVLFYAIWK